MRNRPFLLGVDVCPGEPHQDYMARHIHRAKVLSVNGERLRSIPEKEAYELIESGQVRRLSRPKAPQLVIMMAQRRTDANVAASISPSEMQANATAALLERRGLLKTFWEQRSRDKVNEWIAEHDCFAVTIHGGRVFVPDAAAAMARAADQAARAARS